MGLFRDYFFNAVRLIFIQTNGPLAMLADGAAVCLDTAREGVLTLRNQFFPTLCEDVFLVRFANSRGIVRAPLEPEAHWLERVRFAYLWWSMGGRASAMVEALQVGFGFGDVAVISLNATMQMFDETTEAPLHDETTSKALGEIDSSRWAEFVVIAQLKGNEIRYTREQIIWAINEIKPARSKLAELILIAPLYDESSFANLFDETSVAPLTAEVYN